MATIDLDDLESCSHDLVHLLDLLLNHISDMPFERDGKRDTRMDQLFALARVSRCEVKRTAETIHRLNVVAKQGCA